MTTQQRQRLIAGSVALTLFLTYLSQVPTFPTGYADSDMLLAVGRHLGLAHPPGYPLNSLLLYGFTRLLPIGSVAFRGHVLSALLHSVFFGLLTLLLFAMYSSLKPFKQRRVDWFVYGLAGLSVLLIGLSPIFLINSTVTEKYPLNNLLGIGWLWILWKLRVGNGLSWYWSGLLGFFMGLLLFQHQALWLLALSSGWYLWKKRAAIVSRYFIGGFIISFFCFIGLLLFVNARQVPLSWRFAPTTTGVIDQLTRKELSGPLISGFEQRMYLLPRIGRQFIDQTPHLIAWYREQVGLVGLVLVLIGLVWLLRNRNNDDWIRFVLLMICLTTLLVPLYIPWPQDFGTQSHVERHYLLGLWELTVPLFLGAVWIWELAKKLSPSRLTVVGLIPVLVSLVAWQVGRIPDYSLKAFGEPYHHYREILQSLPAGSRLGCLSDQSCFALFYLQAVDGVHDDVVVVPSAYRFVENKLNATIETRFEYQLNPFVWLEYLTVGLHDHETFVVDMQPRIHALLGIAHGIFVAKPQEGSLQIFERGALKMHQPDVSIPSAIVIESKARVVRQWHASRFQEHLTMAREWARLGFPDLARNQLRVAAGYLGVLPDRFSDAFEANQQSVDATQVINWQEPVSETAVLLLIDQLESSHKLNQALQVAIAGTFALPESTVIRHRLVSLFEQTGNEARAAVEKNRLRLQLKY